MSLLHREPRPLSRDRPHIRYRDDRLFLIACDDRYAPVQYFEFLEIPRVRIVVDPTLDTRSAPQHVLSRLIERRDKEGLDSDDECWLVLDTDHNSQSNQALIRSKVGSYNKNRLRREHYHAESRWFWIGSDSPFGAARRNG